MRRSNYNLAEYSSGAGLRGAGILPAIFAISSQRKNAGETPAPQYVLVLAMLEEYFLLPARNAG
jgi:hypothetical protein